MSNPSTYETSTGVSDPINCEHTAAVLHERWPELARVLAAAPRPEDVVVLEHGASRTLSVDGIRLTSARDRFGEAYLQSSLIPGSATEATVYGVALGDLPRVLLGREGLTKLRVVVLNAGLAKAAFDFSDGSDWLSDPRVELVPGERETEVRTPFAAAPACLRLAEESCARLRDMVHLELATPFIRKRIKAREGELSEQMKNNQARVTQDGRVRELFSRSIGSKVHVAAAGPTLTRSFDLLRDRSPEEPLIAVDATLIPLLAAGIVPDFVTVIDSSRKGILPYFSGDLEACRDSTLVYLPVVHPDVLDRWPGRRLVALSSEARYSSLASASPRDVLFVSGTVLHPSVDLAVQMGASEVELHGVDLSFPDGQSHVSGAAHAHKVASWMKRGVWVVDGRGERVPTLPNLRGYLRDLERYLKAHQNVQFFKPCRLGALIEGVKYREGTPHE